MISIITPCSRPENLQKIYNSIQFDKIHKWIIVYDTTKGKTYKKSFEGYPKIIEVECDDAGGYGNQQRNYGMSLVDDGFIYFLDDDNIVHLNFWRMLDDEITDEKYFYTFNQYRCCENTVLFGNIVALERINTAMYIVHKKHIKDIKWDADKYQADGMFICDILRENPDCHKYVNTFACYHNYLNTLK